MLLTQTTQLALNALLYLARQPAGYLVNPGEIAGALNVAPAYTAKVMRTLARGGFVKSRRGATGGFEILRSPNDLTLLEIVEVCQGSVAGEYCPMAKKLKKPGCGYHRAMEELDEAANDILRKWTLTKLLQASPDVSNEVCRFARVYKSDRRRRI
jgi:Rrf2 family protein